MTVTNTDAVVERASGRVGPYEILGKIADGGMASVYLARLGTERLALKMIREEFCRNRDFVEMFLDEAKIVSRLRHPNIVRTFEQGTVDGQAFIAMEWLDGHCLLDVWEACRSRGVRLRYDMIAWMGARVAAGLHYAHEMVDDEGRPMGIVHRDVNPANIFVSYDGAIKIIDFGLAKAKNRASRTRAGVIKGKLAYMSPEQAAGEALDRRTDVFALGSTLWELACDRRLFKRDDDLRTLEKVRDADVPDPTQLVAGFPPVLWDILAKALVRDPDERTQTAAEMALALDAFAASCGGTSEVARVMEELFPRTSRTKTWVGLPAPDEPSRPSPAAMRRVSRAKALFAAALAVVIFAAIAAALALR